MKEPMLLRIVAAGEYEPSIADGTIDSETLQTAESIVNDVRENGELAIRKYGSQFGEREPDEPLLLGPDDMESAAQRINHSDVELLRRVARRIEAFAETQLESLSELNVDVPGGRAGHSIVPIKRVGCYAPAGRYALPSTVLMTVATAVTAGCDEVILATPNPSDLMLATAAVAGATRVLAVGGAHAVSAMAYGFDDFERCDLICGPGNRFVTAAKKLVMGDCGIDMLAGPSELVLVADETASPSTVAADLLAQAEHDVDARPFLITTSRELADNVQAALVRQLNVLPTSETAQAALGNGAAVVADSIEQAIEICNELAPEHLELHCADAEEVSKLIKNAGCIFIGHASAEVFGDYGVGPNHTLPTSGTSRFTAGLNVFTFLRIRTWLNLEQPPQSLVDDTARLAELEGLFGHQRSALRRESKG